jgi:hypothetical protein
MNGAAGNGLDAPTIKYLRRTASGTVGNGLSTAIKHLRGNAGIGLGKTIKYLRRTKRQRSGHHDQVPATHNERRRGHWLEPIPRINDGPIHHKRPAFALYNSCLLHQQAE